MSIALYALTPDELSELMRDWREPAYRAQQLSSWIHGRSRSDPSEMTDMPKGLRERLAAHFPGKETACIERVASPDGSVKVAMGLEDGAVVECVLLSARTHLTLCVSSQVGCPIGCPFCASGQGGLERNLSAAEILAQYHEVQRTVGPRGSVRNLLFMGIGEPLLNQEALHKALDVLTHPQGVAMGARRITVSTSGVIPGMRRLSKRAVTPELAISLHAAEDGLRDTLVPLNAKYPIQDVLRAAQDYVQETKKISFTVEFVLLRGINDDLGQAEKLARLLSGKPATVNLIRYNPVSGSRFSSPRPETVSSFRQALASKGIETTVRKPAGTEISAGCGQLRGRMTSPSPKGTKGLRQAL